jgi:DNA repair protein RadC
MTLYVRDISHDDTTTLEKHFEENGPEGLGDNELLCLNLDLSPEETATFLATKTLPEFVLLPPADLEEKLGKNKARRLLSGLEIAKRVFKKGMSIRPTISCPAETLPFLTEIREKSKEHFLCLYLDARNQVIHKEIISIGTLSASIVHPREVYVQAISHHAASVILAHNHPSGNPSPSKDDIELTRRLSKAGEIIGIEVIDHIIISATAFISLKEEGLL